MSHLLYQLYELRLRRQIRARPMPEHVGLILDGNRRYARKQAFPNPGRAYEMGAQKLDEVLLWCNELGIPAVTLWVCSSENLKRSHAEVSEILEAVEAKIGALAEDPWIHQRRVRVKAAGRSSLRPKRASTKALHDRQAQDHKARRSRPVQPSKQGRELCPNP